jgi:uncharacterized protein YcgI (DUF1989 family)
MSCNCNKNKNNEKFRTEEIKEDTSIKNKISMVQNFASAIASRGISNKTVKGHVLLWKYEAGWRASTM